MAVKTATIRARVEPELKAEAEGILAELGLSASEAVRLLYQQVVSRKGLPFAVEIPNAKTAKVLRDAEAGKNLKRYPNVDAMFKDMGY